jgi:putative hemolysin
MSASRRPFSIPLPSGRRGLRFVAAVPLAAAEGLLGLARLNKLYARWLAERDGACGSFVDRALGIIGIGYDVAGAGLDRVPRTGPLIVAANHPHGAADGLILASAVGSVRDDVRLVGNYLLAQIPELRPLCIFVDPFGDRRAARRSVSGLREALAWLGQGGALVVFPAGEVAHRRSLRGEVVEPAWHSSVARLAAHSRSPVLPAHIDGQNSQLFQLAGLLHPRLRTGLLARELLAQREHRITVSVGVPVFASDLEARRSAVGRAAYLRLRTLGLAPRRSAASTTCPYLMPPRRALSAVAPPVAPGLLADDIARLDPSRLLVQSGEMSVLCATSQELPRVLPEIGRLREATFRAAGEGTGKACDLDCYDQRYWHLFVWNTRSREVIGAYRLGPTDQVGALRRPRRLYTRSLFKFGPAFLSRLGPSLELGRSFVRQEYQRDYATLMLLWKGIGHFVARQPQYRMLFGPVSVSADYSAAARELLVAALSTREYRSPLGALVRGLRPVDVTPLSPWTSRPGERISPDLLNQLLSEVEPDGKGLPVLMRQYLRLNAKLLAFSVDPDFGHVVDGLMVVDLVAVDRPVLNRYMGREGAAAFLAHHRGEIPRATDAHPVVAPA